MSITLFSQVLWTGVNLQDRDLFVELATIDLPAQFLNKYVETVCIVAGKVCFFHMLISRLLFKGKNSIDPRRKMMEVKRNRHGLVIHKQQVNIDCRNEK